MSSASPLEKYSFLFPPQLTDNNPLAARSAREPCMDEYGNLAKTLRETDIKGGSLMSSAPTLEKYLAAFRPPLTDETHLAAIHSYVSCMNEYGNLAEAIRKTVALAKEKLNGQSIQVLHADSYLKIDHLKATEAMRMILKTIGVFARILGTSPKQKSLFEKYLGDLRVLLSDIDRTLQEAALEHPSRCLLSDLKAMKDKLSHVRLRSASEETEFSDSLKQKRSDAMDSISLKQADEDLLDKIPKAGDSPIAAAAAAPRAPTPPTLSEETPAGAAVPSLLERITASIKSLRSATSDIAAQEAIAPNGAVTASEGKPADDATATSPTFLEKCATLIRSLRSAEPAAQAASSAECSTNDNPLEKPAEEPSDVVVGDKKKEADQ